MLRRDRVADLRDVRSVLSRPGEVDVGAFARRRRLRNAAIAVLGVVLIGSAWLMFRALSPPADDAAQNPAHRIRARCIAAGCGFEGELRVQPGQRHPYTCPKCAQRSCWELWKCRDCGREFLPPRPPPPLVRCPEPDCRSANVGTAVLPPP